MIPNDFTERCRMIEYMIEGLETQEMTEWESDFLMSVKAQYNKNKPFGRKTLSDKQCEVLENMYNKYY